MTSYDVSTTLRYGEKMQQAIDDIVRESKQTPHVPEVTQSELWRIAMSDWLHEIGDDDLIELVEPSTMVLLEREEFLKRDANLTNLRTGFETRVKDMFTRRFKNGYQAEQLGEFAANLREEARILWSDRTIAIEADDEGEAEEMRARRRECIDYVDAVVDNAIEAVEDSDHDPLDPETMFEEFSGVEKGREREQLEDHLDGDLVDDAIHLLAQGVKVAGYSRTQERRQPLDPERVVERLSERTNVSEQEAQAAVDEATRRLGESVATSTTDDGDDDREERSGSVDSDAVSVTDAGVVEADGVEGRGLSDDEPDDVEPDGELVDAAAEALDDSLAVAVIPTMLEAQHGCDTAEAVAARDAAIERRQAAAQGGASSDD